MKKLFLFCLLGQGIFINAQQKQPPEVPVKQMPSQTPGNAAPKGSLKPYKEVITEKSISKNGLFTVHKVDEHYYFELPESLLQREILAVTRFVKVPFNKKSPFPTYGGELTNQQTLSFEKGPANTMFIKTITLVSTADSTHNIFRAVTNSSSNTIAAAFPIVALGRDSSSYVIDVTEYFKGDNQIVSIHPTVKRTFNLAGLAADRSFIVHINTYPQNTEVRTIKTFFTLPATPGVPSTIFLPAAGDAGAVTMELNTSFLLLPEKPMTARYWDKRVGYFWDNYVVYGDEQQKIDEKIIALRWRMEPRDEDRAKWERGELVEPKKPIVYYIDPATPKQWRKYLIQGINDWQVAFEKAGFKNAIMGKEWPEGDSSMSMEDARYSVVRYFASDVQNAYGPNVHDPRSGEILESHIGWYHNVMKLVHDWYMVQASPIDPRARKMKFDDELMGQLIRFVSSHEVGHTLGLMHNMASSSLTPVEKLRDKAWVETHGHTASIMDYARFNYVAQPEDGIGPDGIYPRIGDYDKWAIRWGYGYLEGGTEEEQKKASNRLIIETLRDNPLTYFNTDELGSNIDPRNQREDLGDDAIKASEYGIRNLKRVILGLPDWTREEGDDYSNLTDMYNAVVGQFTRYMNHVARNIGGFYDTPKTIEQDGNVYNPIPKAIQKKALAFINSQLFSTPSWLFEKQIMNKITQPASTGPVVTSQANILNNLMSPGRLLRMINAQERFGSGTYGVEEYLTDLKAGIWSELKTKLPVSLYRRNLQKRYVENLIDLLKPPAPPQGAPALNSVNPTDIRTSDLPSIARASLNSLNREIKANLPGYTDNLTRYHLQDISERIDRALKGKD